MPQKSLFIKIPIHIAEQMSENAHLNPNWIEGFLVLNYRNITPDIKLEGLNMNYTFKIDSELHKQIKLLAFENGMNISEYVGRLFLTYYDDFRLVK
jgi:hypothetical protein